MSEDCEDSIVIRIVTVEDYKEVKLFLLEHFYPFEPLNSSTDKWESGESRETNHLKLIRQGLSLMAIDPTGNILGLAMAGVLNPKEVEDHRLSAEQMENNHRGRILKLLSKAEIEADIFRRYDVSEALYLHILVVATPMRGKRLGARLTAKLMDLGCARALPLAVAHCTSFYSARQLKLMGFECAHAQSYSEYKDERGQVVFLPPEPHTQLQVMVCRLYSNLETVN